MKKTFIIIGISAALFSCKKTERKDFEITDLTGNGILAGKVTKNIIVYESNGSNFTTIQAPVAGVDVTARVNNSDLYPNNPNASGSKNYFSTTDANGDYSMDILSNENGVQARVVFPEWTGTYDTLLNGVVKTGLLNTYYYNQQSTTVWKGMKRQMNYNYWNDVTYGNPGDQQIGTALITGTATIETYKSAGGGTIACCGAVNQIPVANLPLFFVIDTDPSTLTQKTYTTTTDIAGKYTFTVSAHAKNTTCGTLKYNDYVHTRDTTIYTNVSYTTVTTAAKAGKTGRYSNNSWGVGCDIKASEIKVQNFNINMGSFTAY